MGGRLRPESVAGMARNTHMDKGRTFLAEFVCRNECSSYDMVGLTVRIIETTEYQIGQENSILVTKINEIKEEC